jgi:His-Xaa-Ser system protein HxsD
MVDKKVLEGSVATGQFTLQFDLKAYALATIQKACQRYSACASFSFEGDSENSKVNVTVYPKGVRVEGLDDELRTEVLEQQIREVVRTETAGVRNLILAHAFSHTGLIKSDK